MCRWLLMFTRFAIRLVWSAVTLVGTATLAFLLVNAIPGDVARVIAGPKASAEVIQNIHVRYHLDDPVPIRLVRYFTDLAKGDLGRSFVKNESVKDAILSRFPATASLAMVAVTMWMVVAVPLGVLTASQKGGVLDHAILVVSAITLSLPAFWIARMFQYWLAYRLGWFPVAGLRSFSHLLLPGATLAVLFTGYYARLIHSSMCEVLDAPYIRAARAKGLSEISVLVFHGLRNALIPVVTVLGMDVAGLLGGVMFTENIFALPGIGRLAIESVFNLDVPMILGVILFSAAIVVVANLIVDVVYQWIDPRIRGTH